MRPNPRSPAQVRATARRFGRVMPLVFITYSLAYLDRANFGVAAAAGMAADLHLSSAELSAVGSFFSIGYFLFQLPGVIYAQRHSVKRLVGASLILWGSCAVLTGIVHNFRALLAVRVLLGVVEAAVFPALLLHLTRWFTRAERSRANSLLILGNPLTVLWMSVLSGYLIKLANWRWMFIWEGAPSILWAVIWWKLARDRPEDAEWLPENERADLAATLRHEQATVKPFANIWAALHSRTVVFLSLQFFSWTLGVFGFVLWLPSILRNGSKLGAVATGWLSAMPYLAAAAAMIVISAISDRTLNRRRCIWIGLSVAAVALCTACLLPAGHFWLSYSLFVVAGAGMYAPYGPFWALIPELLPQNVAGTAMTLINSAGAFGSFIGAYAVGYLNGGTGGSAAAIGLLGASFAGGAIFIALVD